MPSTLLVPTLGATLIGTFISCILYGVTSLQTFVYFHKFGNHDRRGLKLLIAVVWLLETAHTIFLAVYIFRTTVLDFGDTVALQSTKVYDDLTTAVTALIIFLVHCFYARRLWILSEKNVYLVSVVLVLAVCHFAFEMTVMALTFKFPAFGEFHKITPYYTAALAIAAADDIIIAVALSYLLMHRRSGMRRTDNLVVRIVIYAVSSGILTTITDIVILICFVAMPNNLAYLAVYDFVNNFYANSLLAMLNARKSLQALNKSRSSAGNNDIIAFTDLRNPIGSSSSQSRSTKDSSKTLAVQVETSVDFR